MDFYIREVFVRLFLCQQLRIFGGFHQKQLRNRGYLYIFATVKNAVKYCKSPYNKQYEDEENIQTKII